MAPPRNRRRGFSRRVQVSLFLSYVVAIVGIVASATLLVIQRIDPSGFEALQGVAADLGAPFTAAGRQMLRGVQNIDQSVSAYIAAGSENRALRAELVEARRTLIAAQAAKLENERLRRTLRLVEARRQTIATARIVGSALSGPRRFATITAGARDGVRTGQPVLSIDGLLGRIVATGGGAARVQLLTDGESAVPVRIARNGAPALVSGRGDGSLSIRALAAGAAPFRRGDVALTSGTGGIYPPNIPVAIVTVIDGDLAFGWPLADPARADIATIEAPYEPPLPSPVIPPQP
jgi:rod shape-determining protein MreC